MVELLAVMAIVIILLIIVLPSIGSLLTTRGISRAVSDISLTLEQARSYAMGHQTYVYVGLEETDITVSASTRPQTEVASGTVGGRVFLAAVATRDGTAGYNPFVANSWTTAYGTGANLFQAQRTQYFDNVHLVDLSAQTSGNLARPSAGYQFCNISAQATSTTPPTSQTPFTVPLGTSLSATSGTTSYQCKFDNVIQFDPQGMVTVVGTLSPWIEIGLEPTQGKTVSPNNKDFAVIQIAGANGAVRTYRP